MLLAFSASAQGPLGPGRTEYYTVNGRTQVRVADGGTGAREPVQARRNLGFYAYNLPDLPDSLTARLNGLCGLLASDNTWTGTNIFQSTVTAEQNIYLGTIGTGGFTGAIHFWDGSVGGHQYILRVSDDTLTTAVVLDTLPTYAGSLLAVAGPGTSGKVLKSQGPGYAPIWGNDSLSTAATLAGLTDSLTAHSRAANITGLRDTLSTLNYVALRDPLIRVKDAQLFIKDDADTTKKLQIVADTLSASVTRTWTALDASGTVPVIVARKDSSVTTDAGVSWTILKSAPTGWYELKVVAMDLGSGGTVAIGYNFPNSVLGTAFGSIPTWDDNAGAFVVTATMGLASQASFEGVHRFWTDTVGDIVVFLTTTTGGQVDMHARLEYLGR